MRSVSLPVATLLMSLVALSCAPAPAGGGQRRSQSGLRLSPSGSWWPLGWAAAG